MLHVFDLLPNLSSCLLNFSYHSGGVEHPRAVFFDDLVGDSLVVVVVLARIPVHQEHVARLLHILILLQVLLGVRELVPLDVLKMSLHRYFVQQDFLSSRPEFSMFLRVYQAVFSIVC